MGIAAAKKAQSKKKSSAANKGTKSPKRSTTTPKSAKARKTASKKDKKPMSMAKARRQHKTIPGETYKPKERASQVIHGRGGDWTLDKNTYGPLGHPPENPAAKAKYNKSHEKLTPKGMLRAEKRRTNQEIKYRKALGSWKKEKARKSTIDIRQVKEDLEDWGYSDINPHWRKLGREGMILAWEEMQQDHLSRR